jgi:hypothetical protein
MKYEKHMKHLKETGVPSMTVEHQSLHRQRVYLRTSHRQAILHRYWEDRAGWKY